MWTGARARLDATKRPQEWALPQPLWALSPTSTSSLLARRGTVMTRKWFLCRASLPSKIFRVCLPGPEKWVWIHGVGYRLVTGQGMG